MLKGKKSTVIILLITFMLVLTSCGKPYEFNELEYSNFNIKYTPDNTTPINHIETTKDKLYSFDYLIEIAASNLDILPKAARISISEGVINTGNNGRVEVVGSELFIKSNQSWYNQTIVKLNDATPKAILPTMQSLLDNASRHYSPNGIEVYSQEVSNKSAICMSEDFPYTTCDFSQGKINTVGITEIINYKNEFEQISSYIIRRDTVSESSILIEFEEQKGIYTLEFSLNLETQALRDLATEKPRKIMRDTAKIPNLEYSEVTIKLEIWDNGLIKSKSVYEKWSGDFSIFFVQLALSGEMATTYYYSYHPDDADYNFLNINLDGFIQP